ncbi:MAG: hypothetical protein V2J02_21940 [Pseudomonadales bacterium]|jgi:hypothetical protein|nr:hypothetical protein [Pseudomonadales bacterium]
MTLRGLARWIECATIASGVLCFLDVPQELFDALWDLARSLPRAFVPIAPADEARAQQLIGGFLVVLSGLTLLAQALHARRSHDEHADP